MCQSGNGNALRPGHHYQKFKFHQQQEALAAHFDFTSFSAQPFFKFLAATFFTPGVFWLRLIFPYPVSYGVYCVKELSLLFMYTCSTTDTTGRIISQQAMVEDTMGQ